MPTLEEYLDGVQQRQQKTALLESNIGEAANTNPDEFASMVKLSRAAKISVDAVPDYQELAKSTELLNKTKVPDLIDTNPKTSQFLADPDKAKLASDDIDNFKETESVFGKIGSFFSATGNVVKSGILSANAGVVGAVRIPLDTLNDVAGYILPQRPFTPLTNALAEYQKGITKEAQAALPQMEGDVGKGIVSGGASLVRNTLNIPLIFFGPAGQRAYWAATLAPVGGEEYGKAKEKGLSTINAINYATTQTGIEYLTEKIPMGKLVGDLKAGSPFYKTLYNQLITEIPGEQAATLLQDLTEWVTLNPEKSFNKYLEERPSAALQTLVATTVGVGGSTVIATSIEKASNALSDKSQSADRANGIAEVIQNMNKLSAANKVRTRDADTFKEWIDQVTEDSPIQNVYISAQTLQQSGLDKQLQEIAPEIAAQIETAAALGGDVEISISDYMTKIAPTPLGDAMVDDLRAEGETMTRKEANEFISKKAEELQLAADDLMKQKEMDQVFVDSAKQVEKTMFDQIKGTGAYSNAASQNFATYVRDIYVTKAAAMGITPTELYDMIPYRITSNAPAPNVQLFNQAGEVITESDAFKSFYRNSVFKTEQGTPVMLYHGTADNVTEFDVDHPNRKDSGFLGTGVYLTDSKDMADVYAEQKRRTGKAGPNVMPLFARLENPYFATEEDKVRVRAGGRAAADQFTADLQAQGFDGVIYQAAPDAREIVVFEPAAVKSKFNNGTWSDQNNLLAQAAKPQKPGPDSPGVGLEEGNKLGFWPALRVKLMEKITIPKKPLILTGTTNKNAANQIAAIDDILSKFPKATESTTEWSRMMAFALGSDEVPIPPYAFIRDLNGAGSLDKLRLLTQGQIDDATHGFENAAEFRRAYTSGELGVETTGKLFMWSFLSRGVSPYVQEGLFIDAFNGADKWISLAAQGKFDQSMFPEYEAWAKSVAPAGSGQPGSGATHNLNAFGQDFLFKMSKLGDDGKTHMQRLHDMMCDPNQTGKQIRREFAKFGEGVGIDNKVVSFTLLVAGFPDVMVLDRVQIRQLWDDGRYNGTNLYDGVTEKRMVTGKDGVAKQKNVRIAGSSLNNLAEGVRGILVYEAIERGLESKILQMYTDLGRPQDASIGRYHWETWVADSQQEASHGTLGAILADAKGDDTAIANVAAKQGEYGAYEYGALYNRDETSTPWFGYETPTGDKFAFSVPAFRAFLEQIKTPEFGVVPKKFKVTESGNAPWYNRPEVNTERLNELAAYWADRAGGTGEGQRAIDEAISQQASDNSRSESGNDTLNQLAIAPTFYSQLASTFNDAKQQSMPADQWVNWLNSNASKFGIKKEEIEFSGIRDYLELNGKDKITKDEILKYLNSNGVQIEDVILSDRDTSAEESVRQIFESEGFELNLDYEDGHLGYSERTGYLSRKELPPYLQQALDSLDSSEETKYSSYTLPGGENYKELLLTLPPQKTVVSEIKFESDEEVDNFLTDMSVSGYEDWDYGRLDDSTTVQFNSAIPQVVMAFVMNNNGVITKGKETAGATFASNHWSQQNVLAHIRFNDHKDAEGNKVLFIEEIQSDWHQAGRKQGYGKLMMALPASYTVSQDFATSRFLVKDENGQVVGQGKDEQDAKEFTLWKLNKAKIPDAPFKDTKAWAGLAVKRMIRYAAENGYDKVAFVNGQQSADRYDLSKQINDITIVRNKTNFVITATNKEGLVAINKSIPDLRNLDEIVGKDLAEKFKDNFANKSGNEHSFSGLDLKIGGEGMIKFYDNILPQVVNDTLKKLGGGKMEDVVLVKKRSDFDAEDIGNATPEELAQLDSGGIELIQSGFTVNDAMRQKSMSGQPLFQGTQDSARGGFDPKNLTTILTKESDYSTFLHETSHFYLDMLTQLASMQNAPPSFQMDLNTILEWTGTTPQEWNKWNQEFKDTGVMNKGMRKVHEAFAYNSEIYFATGTAPNLKMQNMFDQFAAWLRRVYKSIRDELNVVYRQENGEDLPILTGEVRQVMDRMLASEEQILQAQSVRNMVPLFQDQATSGMDDATWAAYQAMGQEAQNQSITDLTAASLRQMRWLSNAKSKIFKEMQKENAEIYKDVRAQVAKEVEQQPIYRALRLIKFGEQLLEDGSTVKVEQNTKLSVSGMEELYMGEGDKYALLDWSSLGYGKYGMLSAEGMHPDALAERAGYSSGDELVRALINAKSLKEAVDEKTDQRMLEEYGDLSNPRSMELAVERALHNEARARFVAAELRHASKATQPVRLMLQAARMAAKRIVGGKLIRDTKESEYSAAENRATRAAEKAMKQGIPEEVTKQLQNRLLNNQLTAEAAKAVQEIAAGLRYLKKVQTDASRKRVGADYSDQIDQLLSRFDLNNRTLKAIDAQTSLADWMKSQEDAGYQPEIPLALQNEGLRKNYKNITVDEFRDLIDAVQQIEHMGRTEQNMLTAAKETAYQEARDQIVASINANANGRKVNARTPTTEIGRRLQGLKRFFAAHIKAANVALILDGGKEGPMWEYFIRTANRAGDKETEMRAEATQRLTEIFGPIFKLGKMGGAGVSFPSIGRSLNREARLAIGLNMGNEGNIQRLLDGEGWTREQIKPILDSLSRQEWTAIQEVWDHFETYRPAISQKERRIYGKEPKWIEPKSLVVNLPNGETMELRGGYYPIKYDPQATIQAETGDEKEAAKRQLQGAFTSATTRRSFTKARVEKVEGRPLIYTLAGMYSGINDVIHDLTWHEWLIDANKLLRSQTIDQAIRTQYGPEFKQQLKTWVQDVAAGEQAVQNEGEIALNYLRQSISAAGLGFNVMSALQQVTGFNQSIAKVGARYIGKGIAQVLSNPRAAMKEVNEKSSFMANRSRTQFRELNELRNMVQDESAAMRQVRLGAYFMMMKMQRMVDVPTWLGAYEKAIGEGNDEDRSIALADQSVIDSQGGGMLKDLSRVERGGAGLKLFTVYYSYMNTVFNLATVKTMTAKSKGKLAADYLMLFTVPVVLTTALKQALTPGGDDEWDMEKLARKLAAEQLSYLMGTMIILREFGQAGQIMFGNDKARDYSGPAGLRVIADAVSFLKQASQLEFDDAFRKSAINLLGDVTGLPSAQVNRTITGTQALIEGETDNPAAIILGKEK